MTQVTEVESRLVNSNQHIPLIALQSADTQVMLRSDVAEALAVALGTLRQDHVPLSDLDGYYKKDDRGRIFQLEIRDLPKDVAFHIHDALVKEGLGGFISLREDTALVGLPSPVTSFKRVSVIEVQQ